jgi:hypothetical protein
LQRECGLSAKQASKNCRRMTSSTASPKNHRGVKH